jgi:hypothetical protein
VEIARKLPAAAALRGVSCSPTVNAPPALRRAAAGRRGLCRSVPFRSIRKRASLNIPTERRRSPDTFKLSRYG